MRQFKNPPIASISLLICFLCAFAVYGSVPKVKKPRIVFLISKDSNNYAADETIPAFAQMQQKKQGWTTTILQAEGPRISSSFPGLKNALNKADLLVVFARRLALPESELNLIKEYLQKGKPVIGIRTANHAFSLMEDDEKKKGHCGWADFVPDILGCLNKGYGPVAPGTDVAMVAASKNHPILKGLPEKWHSIGNLYLVDFSIDPAAVPLLLGSAESQAHPVAWTRIAGKSKVFYTSLGHPADFDTPEFETLIINAIKWALN